MDYQTWLENRIKLYEKELVKMRTELVEVKTLKIKNAVLLFLSSLRLLKSG